MIYEKEDKLWTIYKEKLINQYSDLCDPWEIEYAEQLIMLARKYMLDSGFKLINLQSNPRFGPDYEESYFKIEWNIRGKSQCHFSFDLLSPTEVDWMYLNYETQEHKYGTWDFSKSREIPEDALPYLLLLGEEKICQVL